MYVRAVVRCFVSRLSVAGHACVAEADPVRGSRVKEVGVFSATSEVPAEVRGIMPGQPHATALLPGRRGYPLLQQNLNGHCWWNVISMSVDPSRSR